MLRSISLPYSMARVRGFGAKDKEVLVKQQSIPTRNVFARRSRWLRSGSGTAAGSVAMAIGVAALLLLTLPRHDHALAASPNQMAVDADAGTAGIETTRSITGTANFTIGLNVTAVGSANTPPSSYFGYQWEIAFPTVGLGFVLGSQVENTGATGLTTCSPPGDNSAATPDPSDTVIGNGSGCITLGATPATLIGQTTTLNLHCLSDGVFVVSLLDINADGGFGTWLLDKFGNALDTGTTGTTITCSGTGVGPTPTPTFTVTSTFTATKTSTATSTSTATNTPTVTNTPTATPTGATSTPTITPTSTATNTPAPTDDLDHDGVSDKQELLLGTCPGLQPKFVSLPQCHVGGVLANPLIPDARDTDGDGLTDGEEFYSYHTNPLKVDTDNDGLPDGAEVLTFHTNPLLADTDGDGLTDGFEVSVSVTNPAKPNTDGSGCSDTAELGPNHVVGGDRNPSDPNDFFDVPVPALTIGAPNGVRNNTINLNDVLAVLFYVGTSTSLGPNTNGVSYNSDVNGDLIPDGSEYDRTPSLNPAKPWRTGPPNGVVSLNDVIVALKSVGDQCIGAVQPPDDLDHDGISDAQELVLGSCPGLQPKFVSLPQCHISGVLANPLIASAQDTDSDGLKDGEEYYSYHTNPIGVDTDSDGLPDGAEVLTHHSNPLLADTDGDGLADGFEVSVSLTKPITPNTDEMGCSDSQELGPNPLLGGDRDPRILWDYFDVPVPALSASTTTGSRDGIITLGDVLAVLKYVGTTHGGGPNANGVRYDDDVNGDLIPDGVEYDRTPSLIPAKPWRTGPANGVVSLNDVILALGSVGTQC